jgi:uncharacterized protein YdeI (YjbR/CyaY-like superfamily)
MKEETRKGQKAIHAESRAEWREWLEKHHQTEKTILLIMFHKKSKTPAVSLEEAVEEALCFGWIDSKANKRDEESFYLTFTQRKPKSKWSSVNKERVERLTNQGLMSPQGQAFIDLARKTGTWDSLEGPENGVIPEDLQHELDKNTVALNNFQAFAPSSKRAILEWIMNAKRPETRQKRIEETTVLAAQNKKAK